MIDVFHPASSVYYHFWHNFRTPGPPRPKITFFNSAALISCVSNSATFVHSAYKLNNVSMW